MSTTSREIQLKSRPDGMPTPDNFEMIEVELPDPGPGEVLVKNIYMSVDPYMRGRMRFDWGPGQTLQGGCVGKVVASNNDHFAEGDYVNHNLGWREHLLSDGNGLSQVDPSLAPLSTYLEIGRAHV